MGSCVAMPMPDAGAPTGSGGQGGFVILGNGGQGGSTGATTGSGTAGSSATGTGASSQTGAGGTAPMGKISTCSCDTAEGPGTGAVALLLTGVAIAFGRRRVARTRASSSRRDRRR